ncbi:hypothetical protein BD779DRAFT_1701646 [Infundibulicybe gibba]|nr:hypothetical protein BD779DRAFT_1701646 [Infundibulicybe gibba]
MPPSRHSCSQQILTRTVQCRISHNMVWHLLPRYPPSLIVKPAVDPTIETDSFRTTYHPNSGLPADRCQRVDRFDEYQPSKPPPTPAEYLSTLSSPPWAPFESKEAFELYELIHKFGLSQSETDDLLRVIHTLVTKRPDFNVKTHRELRKLWETASTSVSSWTTTDVKVTYQDEEFSFPFTHRSLWGWVTDILSDPFLASQCTWDAEILEKFDGNDFVRFFHEPWTGDRFWNVQSKLPPGGKPLAILLYADKTKLSTFGSQKGYPIIAQLLNLPSHIRNSAGLGGSRVVGFIPILKEDESQKKKKAYVNFKRVIWHETFRILLSTIRDKSFTGAYFKLPNAAEDVLHLFPWIMVFSADYEEQCVVALTRGAQSHFPCPICYIPSDKLSDLRVKYKRRTAKGTRAILREAAKHSKTDAERLLQQRGLRHIQNAFWDVNYSSPFRSLSFDRMHNYPSGLGGRHIWPWLKGHILELGADIAARLDSQMDLMPSWSSLQHFDQVISVDFSDAGKFEDVLKQLFFATQNLVSVTENPEIYSLLKVLRSYINLDSYAALNVHTARTINAGRRELVRFSDRLHAYVDEFELTPEGKPAININFPKAHVHSHMFDDIMNKGVLKNYNTMTNEKVHHILKRYYHERTNFRNIDTQLARIDQYNVASMVIRERIDYLEESLQGNHEDEHEDEEELGNFGRVNLGAGQPARSIKAIDSDCKFDSYHPTFPDFARNLSKYLNAEYQNLKIERPGNKAIVVNPRDMITEYRYLKIYFETTVDWRTDMNRLRCSPMFFGSPRYDNVLTHDANNEPIFMQLRFVFTYQVGDQVLPLALVQPYTYNSPSQRDNDLELIRLRSRTTLTFIPVRSIIRGVLLAPTFSNKIIST